MSYAVWGGAVRWSEKIGLQHAVKNVNVHRNKSLYIYTQLTINMFHYMESLDIE